MATAKRKASAKRSVKSAAKTAKKVQSKAAHAATAVAKSAAHQNASWAQRGANDWQKGANEWQKGANEWAKQSAKLYQLPFGNGDVNEATQQAAATVQSATENMVRASNDMMQKLFGGQDPMAQWKGMWGQMPQMPDAEAATDKLRNFARESTEHMNKAAATSQQAMNEAMQLSRENAEAAVECTNIAVAVSKEVSAELIAYLNKAFSQNVELSKQMLTCRTLNDLFDLSSKFAKTNLDGFFSESVKLSELLFQSATEITEPMNERVSETSERLTKVLAA